MANIILLFFTITLNIVYADFKVVSYFNTTTPITGDNVLYIKNNIEKLSNNQIKFKIYKPNTVIKKSMILEAVNAGSVDIGISAAGFAMKKLPASPLFSAIPFGPSPNLFAAWIYEGDGLKLWQKMYDKNNYNVKVIPCGILPTEAAGWFAKPIKNIKDFKGMKLRYFGLAAKVMEKLGAKTVLLPSKETFNAIKDNIIDGGEFSMPSVDTKIGLYKLLKYYYFPGWHQPSTFIELLFNKTQWNLLNINTKNIIKVVCRAASNYTLTLGESLQPQALQNLIKKHKVKVKEFSPKIIKKLNKTWQEVAKEESSKNKFFKEVYQNLQKFLKENQKYTEIAYIKYR